MSQVRTRFLALCVAALPHEGFRAGKGGAFHVDGEGTLITSPKSACSIPHRNPHLVREEIEIKAGRSPGYR